MICSICSISASLAAADVCAHYSPTIATRGKKQHRLKKATSIGNMAMVERKQEQEIGLGTAKVGESYLLHEIGLSKSPHTVTVGQHDADNNEDSNNSVGVQEVCKRAESTTNGVTTIQVQSSLHLSKPKQPQSVISD